MPDESSPHYLEVLYDKLALELGRAVWSFAQIEWVTYQFMKRLSTDELDQLAGDVSFRGRLAMVRKLINRANADDTAKTRALTLLKDAEKLAEKRNLFVHNPWRIWVDIDGSDLKTEIQKYTRRDHRLDLSELKAFVVKAENLEAKLQEALGAL